MGGHAFECALLVRQQDLGWQGMLSGEKRVGRLGRFRLSAFLLPQCELRDSRFLNHPTFQECVVRRFSTNAHTMHDALHQAGMMKCFQVP